MSKLTLRSCIEAEDGYVFISLDASQIELRVAGVLSQDPLLLEALKTSDLHLTTAIQVFGFTEDKDEMALRRYNAKQLNFAILYGASGHKIAEMSGTTEEFANEMLEKYFNTYRVLKEWIDSNKERARETGYVQNMFGRIRPLPDINSKKWKLREAAEREVINTLVQGTAVDIFKLMMMFMRESLPKEIRLVLQVHDEMLWECPEELVEQALEKFGELDVVFPDYPCKILIGKYYGELVTVNEWFNKEKED